MFSEHSGYLRFARTLTIKGAALVALGATALLWSNPALVNAMMLASFVMIGCGVYEVVLGVRAHRVARGWPIPIAEGVSSFGPAALGVTLTAIPLRATLVLAALWLGAYAVAHGALALALWPMFRTRVALLTWAAFNLLLAGLAASSHASIFTVLYAGAAYAVVFGGFQMLAGRWVRLVAAKEAAPTRQSEWRLAAASR